MTTYGFSAFLKLVNSSAKRQRSLISERLAPSDSGYDFHKAMRGICGSFVRGESSLEDGLTSIQSIKRDAERNSALLALRKLSAWRAAVQGEVFRVPDRVFDSPLGSFKVRSSPDFGVTIDGRRTSIHLWNTKVPRLDARLTRAAMSIFTDIYSLDEVEDFGVLSLIEPNLILLSSGADSATIGSAVIDALEELFLDIKRGPEGPSPEDRPAA